LFFCNSLNLRRHIVFPPQTTSRTWLHHLSALLQAAAPLKKMPRKQFIADVQAAADKNILGITSVVRGDDDGEVVACFSPPTGAPIEISLLAQPGTQSPLPILLLA